MLDAIRTRVLPEGQRRTLEQLSDDLDLRAGDTRAKQSAFWTMLTLSAVIATSGVLSDSTATVIGAMIIAPLSTPIMGIALGVVKQQRNGSVGFVLLGGVMVIAVGALFSVFAPSDFVLLDDSQIASRTSPGILDLVAAVATGFAGAVALARRDVAAVLPGVAIAISLVPPLAVVGVCLGQASLGLALGALLLFLSNVLALILAGIAMFTVLGYTSEAIDRRGGSRRRTHLILGALVVLVVLPLAANTALTYQVSRWEDDVRAATEDWLRDTPESEVTSVDITSTTAHVHIRHTGGLPPFARLLSDLDGVLPNGIKIVLDTSVGREVDVGTTGDG